MRTSVAIGAPTARYSPREVRRWLTAPSIGASTTVSVSCWRGQVELGPALGQHGLPVAHLFERVLVPPLGHLDDWPRPCRAGPGR
jgi:hypothetical protein